MKNIKSIIFDLGAVILNISYQNIIDNFKDLGIKNPQVFYSKKTQINLFNKLETGKISEEIFLLELQKETSRASVGQVKKSWNSMLLDLPDKRLNLLKKLNQNYATFLLSNTNSIHISEFKKKIRQ